MRSLGSFFRSQKASHERSLFDDEYYRKSYLDVTASGQDCFNHFMKYGWREGRNPSAAFLTLYYRDKHLDGKQINPLTHYSQEGKSAGLTTNPTDDEYIDVQKPIVQPFFDPSGYSALPQGSEDECLTHYLRGGWRENIQIRTAVSVADHVDAASYIKQLNISPLYHYASQRRFLSHEKRSRSAGYDGARGRSNLPGPDRALSTNSRRHIRTVIAQGFDREFYLSRYQDVQHAKVDPLDHFIDHGWRENRRPNLFFDPAFYLREYPDSQEPGINPFFHYLTVGRHRGLRPNPIGLRAYPKMEAPSDGDWTRVTSAADVSRACCVVVMPVYKGYDETLAAIYAVLNAAQTVYYALHVVDDRSPDPALSKKLAELASRGLFSLSVNLENLGFVKSVNAALRRFADQTVVLMNTDAKVSGNWLDRMAAHADSDPTVATVTPFSNNATIFSYPLLNENNAIEMEVDFAAMDWIAAEANAGRSSEVPVGVGFCFLMSVAARKVVGLFDEEAFGKGYGEESDFCMRAAKAGLRNVLAEDVFVYHLGQVSFGQASGDEAPGQKALVAKHPEYPEHVRQHLRADSTEVGRIRLDLRRLAVSAGRKPTIVVYHALTGGIVTHVRQETQRLLAANTGVILVRVGAGDRWNVEVAAGAAVPPFTPNLRAMAFGQFREHLADFFRWLDPGLIHIHSFVGFEWNATVAFMELVRATGAPYRFTLHDYSVVCHRNDLVLTSNRYCGLADVERCRLCVATDRSYPETTDPAILRDTYARFLEGAEQVQAPSRDIAERLHRAGARYAIDVVPHSEEKFVAPAIAPPADPSIVTIVALGAVGAHKGSRIILSLARDAKTRDLPVRYHIIGYSDVTDSLLEAGVAETGRYSNAQEAMEMAASLSPDLIFLPSIWPETWSYTLSLAFALRVPPIVFDIGAPADRVRQEGIGEILPYALIHDIKALNDRLIDIVRRPQGGKISIGCVTNGHQL